VSGEDCEWRGRLQRFLGQWRRRDGCRSVQNSEFLLQLANLSLQSLGVLLGCGVLVLYSLSNPASNLGLGVPLRIQSARDLKELVVFASLWVCEEVRERFMEDPH